MFALLYNDTKAQLKKEVADIRQEIERLSADMETYDRGTSSWIEFMIRGDDGASKTECIKAQKVIDGSKLNDIPKEVYSRFCNAVRKLPPAGKRARIENFFRLILNKN